MDLKLNDQWFLVGGASSGLGKAVAERLLAENAHVFAIARREEELLQLEKKYPGKVKYLAADITKPETIEKIRLILDLKDFSGMLVNAGGPPAISFQETRIEDWDEAYRTMLRWKVLLLKLFLPVFMKKSYGSILFIESFTVKQPTENLVLSNSLRLGTVGMVKTISQEMASYGITLNVLGPGFHDTAAAQRVFKKKSDITGMGFHEAKDSTISNIPMRTIGQPDDFATLAVWLLSPYSKYVTGQTYCIDGGMVQSSL